MLALVKSLIAPDAAKDRFDSLEEAAPELEPGCTLTFAAMPQEALSGKHLRISSLSTYSFEQDRFLAFTLEGEVPVTLIVAEAEDERYLALSRLLSEEDQDRLFGAQSLVAVVDKPSIQQLRAKENIPEFKGWTVGQYRKQIEGVRGNVTLGDPRAAPVPPKGEEFRYCLLTSPGNDYAVEIEKYESGALKVYATAFRPPGDIVHVAVPMKTKSSRRNSVRARPWLSETGGMDTLIETIRQNRARANAPITANSAEILRHPSMAIDQAMPQETMLECDVRVAVRVIEEATLNKMPISEVVRRVLGLPVAFREKVFFSMPLSERDYAILGLRYGLASDDKVGIRYRIVRELSYFAGEA